MVIIGLFVDDMLASYNKIDINEWNYYKQLLKDKYEISDLGGIHHILGMRIVLNDKKLYIDQQVYINETLKTFNMNECKSMSTPEDTIKLRESKIMKEDLLTGEYAEKFRSIVGKLIYASISTRPDITHAVNIISRYMSSPSVFRCCKKNIKIFTRCSELWFDVL